MRLRWLLIKYRALTKYPTSGGAGQNDTAALLSTTVKESKRELKKKGTFLGCLLLF
jgi:hypothetical protein